MAIKITGLKLLGLYGAVVLITSCGVSKKGAEEDPASGAAPIVPAEQVVLVAIRNATADGVLYGLPYLIQVNGFYYFSRLDNADQNPGHFSVSPIANRRWV
ncbi:hypothetical protein FE784_22800 [Paenibacillus hemerocallicola]|uniref:Uncharacterized protein n=1 Tax=Paenibacillus hemerocallicola TaxID=1172614 RepID=A0A5C4T6N2_9BACL|nr:hypothetical protein [Paenibacillus hemerocallicola]TNJ63987.1 hypothetical protein FE784_22800 [Paenibacillus hemerocallicola]